MAVLLDRLSQRGVGSSTSGIPSPSVKQISPLPNLSGELSKPPVRPLTTTPLSKRLSQAPERGSLGTTFQGGRIKNQFIADLPANVQIQGIEAIISGQESTSPVINNFVKGMAGQGKSAEEIRQAFVAQQKTSANPLVLQ